MSSVSSSSRGSRSTLSEETEQMVSYWERFMPGLNRQPEPPLDDSQYVAATNRGTANSGNQRNRPAITEDEALVATGLRR
ncbi:hypothetical protein MRX96_034182 [Rhipicephalus microplus]